MHLHCLGTTGYHPSPTRHTACYYLPESSLLLDAGTGLFRLIEHLLREPRPSLDILLSHAHLDHVVGLTFLLDALAVTELKTIRVRGELEKLEAVQRHLYSQLLFPVEPTIEFVALSGSSGSLAVGEVDVHYFPLEHPGGSLGFVLVSKGKRLAYITDTIARPSAAYISHLSNLDLLLHECYFNDQQQGLAITTGHSWLSGVVDLVSRRISQTNRFDSYESAG